MPLDQDGYPTKESLIEIESFDLGKSYENLEKFLILIYDTWWASDWGYKYHPITGCLELHTGGWSGNEDVIRSLKKQKWFWIFFWEKSTRGGHFWFKLFQFDEHGKQCIPQFESVDKTSDCRR